jgi:hypothetical protein
LPVERAVVLNLGTNWSTWDRGNERSSDRNPQNRPCVFLANLRPPDDLATALCALQTILDAHTGPSDLVCRRTVRATQNLLTILYACANARLPWGVEWDPFLPLCVAAGPSERMTYILCCGHVVSPKFAQKLISEGLMKPGEPDKWNRPTITIAEGGRKMLSLHPEFLRTFEGELEAVGQFVRRRRAPPPWFWERWPTFGSRMAGLFARHTVLSAGSVSSRGGRSQANGLTAADPHPTTDSIRA